MQTPCNFYMPTIARHFDPVTKWRMRIFVILWRRKITSGKRENTKTACLLDTRRYCGEGCGDSRLSISVRRSSMDMSTAERRLTCDTTQNRVSVAHRWWMHCHDHVFTVTIALERDRASKEWSVWRWPVHSAVRRIRRTGEGNDHWTHC